MRLAERPGLESIQSHRLGDLKAALGRVFRASIQPVSLFRHWRVGVAALVIALAGSAVYLIFRPDSYVGVTSVLVRGGAATQHDVRELLSANSDISDLEFQRVALLARIGRLNAELSGSDKVSFGADAASPRELDIARDVRAREMALFDSRKRAFESEISGLQRVLVLNKQEVESLKKQVGFSGQELAAIDSEIASVRSLFEKSLTPASRLRDLERIAAATASRKTQVETELLSREQNVLLTDQAISDKNEGRTTEALGELQESQERLRTAEAKLTAARAIVSAGSAARTIDTGFIEDQISAVRSERIAVDVVRKLNLAVPEFISMNRRGFLGQPDPPKTPIGAETLTVEQAAVLVLQRDLSVVRSSRGSQLDVRFMSSDPRMAEFVANGVVASYAAMQNTPYNSYELEGDVVRQAVVHSDNLSPGKLLPALVFMSLLAGLLATLALSFWSRLRETFL